MVFAHMRKEWSKNVEDILKPHHLEDLRKSGLSDETILSARIYSVSSKESKGLLNRLTEIGQGFVIPYPTADGFHKGDVNFKPDTPLKSNKKERKARKYVRPRGVKSKLYIPPKVWSILDDISIPIFITEGEKKSLKASQEGFPTVAISGVWNWSSDHQPIEDLSLIKLQGRTVYLVFDSDKASNQNVSLAERRLAEVLTQRGAVVKIIDLPERLDS